MGPSTQGGGDLGDDLTRWQFWWELNKDRYLGLRARMFAGDVQTTSVEFWLGHGEKDQARDLLRPSRETVQGVVVPALLAALERETANDAVTGAMIALARIGAPLGEDGSSPLAAVIARKLLDSNQEISETAALALGLLGHESSIDVLAALVANDRATLGELGVPFVSDVPERTRAFAAFGLGILSTQVREEARPTIVRALTGPLSDGGRSFARRDVPSACALALGLVELSPAPPVADDADEPTADPAPLVFREQQVAWLLERFEDREASALIRAQLPRSLALLAADLAPGHPLRASVAEALIEPLSRSSRESAFVQQSCTLALGILGDADGDALDTAIRAALAGARDLPDQQVKRFASIALAQVAGRPGTGPDPLAAFGSRSHDPRTILMTRLVKGQSGERCFAALALAVLERGLAEHGQAVSSDSLAALRSALDDASTSDEIGAYAIALGIARDGGAADLLLEKLERTADPDARGYVALALGMVGSRASAGRIHALVGRSQYDPDLLRSAATALGLLGDREAVPQLATMLQSARSLASQAAIASALGSIGDVRSIQPLIALLRDQERTALARGFAAAALGIVGDEDDLPWRSHYSLDLNYRANTESLHSPEAGTGLLEIL